MKGIPRRAAARRKVGRLIVIDGTDGSGKATQTLLLKRRLEQEGLRPAVIDFPQYTKNLFGSLIGDCLVGKHGDFLSLSPHIASVLYAADRFESKTRIEQWLGEGRIVITDRYVSANQIHQGAKITDARKRRVFLEWIEKMEYDVFEIPRPDMVLYLDVPKVHSERLLDEKSNVRKKRYAEGKRDIAEANPEHLDAARRNALRIVKEGSAVWVRIPCTSGETLLSPQSIGERIWKEVRQIL